MKHEKCSEGLSRLSGGHKTRPYGLSFGYGKEFRSQ